MPCPFNIILLASFRQLRRIDWKSLKKRAASCAIITVRREQIGLTVEGKYNVLVNPFPILPHRPYHYQSSPHAADDEWKLVVVLSHRFAVRRICCVLQWCAMWCLCPDHMHFQAGARGIVPLERDWQRYEGRLERVYPQTPEKLLW